jgi:molybdenum cofactor biosynthesis enzyme MoaA
VFMRGDPAIRKDIVELTTRARELGYIHVQLQTNGRMLSYRKFLDRLTSAGAGFFEVSLFGDQAGLHDEIAGADGAFAQTTAGLKNLVQAGADFMVGVPVMSHNFQRLPAVAELLAGMGVARVQFNFARPVRYQDRWVLDPIVRLSMAAPFIREAVSTAKRLGMAAGTEAVPFCHLDAGMHPGGDAGEDWGRHAVSDLHGGPTDMAEIRSQSRPRTKNCAGCVHEPDCPRTWAGYLQLFGDDELFRTEPRRFERE